MSPAGIEPATFRFVAQYLNHCATAGHSRSKENKNLPHFRNRRLFPMFTRTFHFFLSQARWIQSATSQSVFKIKFVIILPPTPKSFKWPFFLSLSHHFVLPHMCHTTVHLNLRNLTTGIIFAEEYEPWNSAWCNIFSVLLLPAPNV